MDEVVRLARPVPADMWNFPDGARNYCAVTFDDGFTSVVDNALPELESRHIPSTVFVPSGNLGKNPGWIQNTASPAGQQIVLSADQLVALKKFQLVTIGSHSVSHPNFLKLDSAQASQELTQSKVDLEQVLVRTVNLFSFPYGAYDERIVAMAKAAGYHRVFTIDSSSSQGAPDSFVVGRVPADPDDWMVEFRLKLPGAYRWLALGRSRKKSFNAA